MLVTWGGFGVLWRKPVVTVYIRQSRYTKEILDAQDYFTLSFLPEVYKPQESYLGSHSGRNEDKFAGSGLHPYFPDEFSAGVEEAHLILICRKIYTHEIYERWNSGKPAGNNHSAYLGEIVKILVKE